MPLQHVWLYPKRQWHVSMAWWYKVDNREFPTVEISVKDNSATESSDYEALTADINGHDCIKVEIKDSHGLLSSPAIIVIRVVDENEPPYFVVDETRARVGGEYGPVNCIPTIFEFKLSFVSNYLTSHVIHFEADEDILISWTNQFVKDHLKASVWYYTYR